MHRWLPHDRSKIDIIDKKKDIYQDIPGGQEGRYSPPQGTWGSHREKQSPKTHKGLLELNDSDLCHLIPNLKGQNDEKLNFDGWIYTP